ncbi:MAG: hypothetical protein AB8G22_04275 [Saprospiraceae bacterium]
MTFKNFIHGLYFLALFSISFTACQKDLDLPEPTAETTEEDGGNANNNTTNLRAMMQSDTSGCFEPTFPITFLYEDGTTVTAEAEEDLDDIFENEPYPEDIEFPINLMDYETGETAVANNEEELDQFFEACFGDEEDWDDEDDWDDEGHEECEDFIETIIGCYELTFPFTLELEDETTVTVNDEEELEEVFFSDNPPVDFVFPFTLVSLEDETEVTVNSEEEIEELLENCEDFYDDWDEGDELEELLYALECFTPNFPLTFILEDESTITINSIEEIFALAEAENLPEDIQYPFDITINETGDVKTINNEEDLDFLFEYCDEAAYGEDDYEEFFEVFECFTPVFPVDFVLENGETATVNSIEDIEALFENETYPEDVVYPLEVVINETGETQTVENEEALDVILEACED